MKLFFLLLLISSLIFSSCCKKVEHTFYYSNGEKITDSIDIALVSKELRQLTGFNHRENLTIYSSLCPSKDFKFNFIIDSIQKHFCNKLIEKYPAKKNQILALPKDKLISTGILILDNVNGKILVHSNSNAHLDLISKFPLEGNSSKLYGFILAMDKEFNINDQYIHWENQHYHLTNKKMEHESIEYKDSIVTLFSKVSGGNIIKYPYQFYTNKDWEGLIKMLKLKNNFQNFHPYFASSFESNFGELTSIFQMLNKGGKRFKNKLIDKIYNSSGNLVHITKVESSQLISNKTNFEMEQILNYYNINGQGQYFHNNINSEGKFKILRGKGRSDQHWVIFSNEKYTIGIIYRARLIIENKKRYIKLSINDIQYPKHLIPLLELTLKEVR